MSKRIFLTGNYFKIIDTDTGHPEINNLGVDTYYHPDPNRNKVYFYDRSLDNVLDDSKGTRDGYLLSELVNGNDNDAPFLTYIGLTTFLDKNTGGAAAADVDNPVVVLNKLATNDLGRTAWGCT